MMRLGFPAAEDARGGTVPSPGSGCPLLQPQPRHPDVPLLCFLLRAKLQPWLHENLCLL